MKVKHILLIIIIVGAAASAVYFGLLSGDTVEGPKPLHMFDGGQKNRFKEPSLAVTDHKGRIVVADSGNHRIVILNSNGKFITEIGGPKSEKPLNYPYGLGLIGKDSLLVADIEAGALLEYSLKGKFRRSWHSGGNFKPAGVFVTPDREVYVSDLAGKQILIFTEQGKLLKAIKPRNVELDAPQGIWVNPDGTVWVADSGNYNVKLLGKNGELLNIFDGGPDLPLSSAKGLAVDDRGRIYVSDTLSSIIRVFDSKGNNIERIGQENELGTELQFPVGLFVDGEDNLYITDQGNNKIQVWNLK